MSALVHNSGRDFVRATTRSFGEYVRAAADAGDLVVQPRMGFSDPDRMRQGLLATKHARARTVGTITLDSYTRLGQHAAARRAMGEGSDLNGYPIVAHGAALTREVVRDVRSSDFPIQVRHGSPDPRDIFTVLMETGLDATEGGPVSYCLPYSRTPLSDSVASWTRCCEWLAALRDHGARPHLETFGGCMMGQLCPPGLLVAISVLEAMFFRQHGVHSISLSYAQQTSPEQDEEAVVALRSLAGALLGDVDWHVVVYAYMGKYPRTPQGARLLLDESARLAVRTGAARLIVKTAAEAFRIPTIGENVRALEEASSAARDEPRRSGPRVVPDNGVAAEARALVEAVLDLGDDVGRSLTEAFRLGLLDVPYCLHPDNAGRSRSHIDDHGRLRWSDIGAMPLRRTGSHQDAMTSSRLLGALSYVEQKFDRLALERTSDTARAVQTDWSQT
jgi:methylaspartate mutase epsilon subunit